ncbi:SRPBCC family protein [Demequina sp.]|uniref:SRPBCC family protein n=1 Tax=Demequina sp. TaxID=2050685 RepID=UPI0025B81418|nr:SRPBCC family protein [Demequina sp.]
MPLSRVVNDPEALTITVVADFPVPVERLWNAYADPRQLERFWGPPEYPAKFTRHDLFPGGRSHYVMTGPEGDKAPGFWEVLAVDPGKSFEVRDGFADEAGVENTAMPSMRMVFTFEATEGGSRVTTVTHFGSTEQLEQLLAMGMDEGMRSAIGQIDDVLADLASFAAERATEAHILSDSQVRVTRVVRGSVEQVWRAHHDADLMKRWLLGPDGWTMTVCEIATKVGDTYRYCWEPEGEGEGFGFDGVLLESVPPRRAVTTEHMTGTDYPSTTNQMTLTPVDGGTLLSIVITYPSAEVRDMVLATGMTDGMETSYARLERDVLVGS